MSKVYGDYSLMAQRRAGQAWSGGQAASQWVVVASNCVVGWWLI